MHYCSNNDEIFECRPLKSGGIFTCSTSPATKREVRLISERQDLLVCAHIPTLHKPAVVVQAYAGHRLCTWLLLVPPTLEILEFVWREIQAVVLTCWRTPQLMHSLTSHVITSIPTQLFWSPSSMKINFFAGIESRDGK